MAADAPLRPGGSGNFGETARDLAVEIAGADFRRFVTPGCERLLALGDMLSRRGLEYRVLPFAGRRHILVRFGRGAPRIVLAAHYDRSPGSAGALDNGAACLALAAFGARIRGKASAGRSGRPALALLFTDGEEAPAGGNVLSQGSWSLARGLCRVFSGTVPPPLLVLDVVGRGDRLVLSRTPAEAVARNLQALGPAEPAVPAAQVRASARVPPRNGAPSRTGARATAHTRARAAAERLASLEELALSTARSAGLPEPSRLTLPWSDDLGFLLGGFPALALSVLPAGEIVSLESGGQRPATWDLIHGPGDRLEVLEPRALALVARFLDAIAGK